MSGEYGQDLFKAKDRKAKSLKLQWTGSIVELVEFAYAAIECKSFNDGDIEIKELVSIFSEYFGVNVKDCYRVFVDIRHRTGNRTIYLDRLRKKMMERLEKLDSK